MLRILNCVLVAVAMVAGVVCGGWAADAPVKLYVATNGNDAWSGTLDAPNVAGNDGPFATVERARDEIRKLKKGGPLLAGGVNVLVRAGSYCLAKPLELTAEDSGTANAPVTYSAFPGEEVRIVGGNAVTNFVPVTDAAILSRLDEGARGKVMQADLKALGITDFGAPNGGGMEVFFQDKAMTVARWPNDGFVKIVDLAGGEEVDVRGTKGDKIGKWTYDGDRPKRWTGENEAWVHGYWFWDWSDQRHKIKAIDAEKRTIEVEPPYHGYGYRKGQWYYAFNILAELDTPGEWYVDRVTGILYFWPPAPLSDGKVVVSVIPTLVAMKDASYVTFRKMTFEAARATAVTISGGEKDCVAGCVLRNCGASAVSISGPKPHSVVGCDIYGMGGGGISLMGGDRTTLTAAGHDADNNHIHDYGRWNRMYQAGISINGVGNRASHNLIHDAPHIGIVFGGNDHVMELNEIHSVCYESNDAGAIYAGRDWTMRGNVIRNNYMHHVNGFEGRGCVGVYLDDMFASAAIEGNVFYKVTMAAFLGGGRDCTIANNVFVDCDPALHIDARALGWAHDHADGWINEAQEKGTLCGIAYNKPPYSERYPQLINILNENPKAPVGNLIARNICVGGKWDNIEDLARPLLKFEDNLLNEDPHFVDVSKQDFRLKEDSPAFKLGFKPIPIDKIGLYSDDQRASWPVTHAVRETSKPVSK